MNVVKEIEKKSCALLKEENETLLNLENWQRRRMPPCGRWQPAPSRFGLTRAMSYAVRL